MTVGEALRSAAGRLHGAGIDDARLEAEVLLAHALGTDRAHLLAELRSPVVNSASEAFERGLRRRLRREPLAYITGHREFYGIDFICGAGALIPRPESELLVDCALRTIGGRAAASRIADVGTGAGAIAIAIALNARSAEVVAIERSADARTIAAANLRRHRLGHRVELRPGDLLEGAGVFDIIVANLPYIAERDWPALPPEIRDHEPREALVGGPRGTELIEALLYAASSHLAPDGVLAAEIGDTQAEYLAAAARSVFPEARVCVMKDLAGRDRVLDVRRGGGGWLNLDALRASVDAQARARIDGNTAVFASYMAPQALLQLGGAALPPGRIRKYSVLDISAEDDRAGRIVDVRYAGAWTYAIRMRWQVIDGAWKATEAALLDNSVRAPWWRRLIGRNSVSRMAAEPRRDLS